MRKSIQAVLAAAILFYTPLIFAQKRKKKVYVVDFQDEFIEGHVKNPNIFHLFNKQQLEYDSLVSLKKDFLPELRKTAGEID